MTASQLQGRRRFIPAGAGNTMAQQFKEQHKAVYPRWRGEHSKIWGDEGAIIGLSPLARGTRAAFYTR
ncbi:hypothetical protein SEEV1955_12537 [Salmonella enterica subsp. enterica serovar Virchow str. ATCC 51955]|nr:hypothetical protein SEEV1955_12537 [Salmonella enterica subsp. enterica serovar Virchow str. ATCC 51955]